MEELKPCPFCGGKAWLEDWELAYEYGTSIHCAACGAGIHEGIEDGDGWHKRAVNKWNRRPATELIEREARTMADWISVKERLPEHFGWYLVCIRGWVTLAWFDSTGWDNFQTCVAKHEQVTDYMPLPEPPKEEN